MMCHMSTTTSLHRPASIQVTSFPACDPPFVSVKISDEAGNSVTVFPADLDEFAKDMAEAIFNVRVSQ